MSTKKSWIKWRSFVSLYLVISFFMMLISGVIMYLAPPGRIANWSNWSILGFTKKQWIAQHTLFSFLWVITVTFHLIYNWKPIVSYFRERMNSGSKIKRESFFALIVGLFVFFGTFFLIPPFSMVVDFGEYLTDSWGNPTVEPPIPHAEELKLYELASQFGTNFTELSKILKQEGYLATDSNQLVGDFAEKFDKAPSDIFTVVDSKLKESRKIVLPQNVDETDNSSNKTSSANENIVKSEEKSTKTAITTINNEVKPTTKYVAGSGYGRKMLSEILSENNISWSEGVKRLNANGIKIEKDDNLKEIATENGVLPADLIKAISNVKIEKQK